MTNAIAEQDGMVGSGTSADMEQVDASKRRQHTPGPWAYRPNEFDDWGTVRGPDGQFVAKASPYVNGDDLNAHRHDRTDPAEANARLIASAPKLLEALRPFAELYDGDDSDLKDGVDGVVMAPMRQSEIRAAFLALSSALGA